jgi:inner membrane protein
MTGKTHTIIGLSTVALLFSTEMAKTPSSIMPIIYVTTFAAILADIDLKNSKISNKFRSIAIKLFIIMAALLYVSTKIDLLNSKYTSVIKGYKVPSSLIIGIILMLILIIFAKTTEHRSFTHSILGATLFIFSFYLIDSSKIIYFAIAYLLHLAVDISFVMKKKSNKNENADNKGKGIELLYPIRKKFSLNLLKINNAEEVILRYSLIALTVFILIEPIKKMIM